MLGNRTVRAEPHEPPFLETFACGRDDSAGDGLMSLVQGLRLTTGALAATVRVGSPGAAVVTDIAPRIGAERRALDRALGQAMHEAEGEIPVERAYAASGMAVRTCESSLGLRRALIVTLARGGAEGVAPVRAAIILQIADTSAKEQQAWLGRLLPLIEMLLSTLGQKPPETAGPETAGPKHSGPKHSGPGRHGPRTHGQDWTVSNHKKPQSAPPERGMPERRQSGQAVQGQGAFPGAAHPQESVVASTGIETEPDFLRILQWQLAQDTARGALVLVRRVDTAALTERRYGASVAEYLDTLEGALRSVVPADVLMGRIGAVGCAVLLPMPLPGGLCLHDILARCRAEALRAVASLGQAEADTICIGVSRFPEDGTSATELLQTARAAARAARKGGGFRTQVFDPTRHPITDKSRLDHQVSCALRQGRILPFFQPIVDITTGRCAGFEVLARWHTEDGVLLSPAAFADTFRDQRTAGKITQHMLTAGLDQFSVWRSHAGPIGDQARMALNLTSFDLLNPDFVMDMGIELAAHNVPWSAITLEVTEAVVLGGANGQVFRTLSDLRACGAVLAMDDFGTGYGSFRHLGSWPIDMLKIERQFVRRICDNVCDRAVIEAILGIGSRCDMSVVIEGVETPAQLAMLRDMGARLVQGYLFSRPLPPAALRHAPTHYDTSALDSTGPSADAPPGRLGDPVE